MVHFLHTFQPHSILATVGPLSIHWYGLTMAAAIAVAVFVAGRCARHIGLYPDRLYDLAFWLVVGGLFGARLYAVSLDLSYYLARPFEIIAVWHGGLAIHGALLGGALTLIGYCIRFGYRFWPLADLLVVGIPLGQAIGRWGNYFNQELFGWPTSWPWGIPIGPLYRPALFINELYFQPAFLYESLLSLLSFLIILTLFRRIYTKNATTSVVVPGQSEKRIKIIFSWQGFDGLVALSYVCLYAVIRIVMEYIRIDSTPLVNGVRLPIIVSCLMLISAGGVLLWRGVHHRPT